MSKHRYRPPFLIHAIALLALGLLFGRGLQLGQEHQQMLRPSEEVQRVSLTLGPELTPKLYEVGSARAGRYVLIEDLPEGEDRWALYQLFPARSLLRWLAPWPTATRELLIPLQGLEAGDYGLVSAGALAEAGPREMDRPQEELDLLLRLRVGEPTVDRP